MENNSYPLRILQVVTSMRRGGIETMLMNYYRAINRDKIQFDFLIHQTVQDQYNDEIEKMGGRIYQIRRMMPNIVMYEKELGLFFDEHPEYRVVHVHMNCLSSIVLRVAKAHGVRVRIAHSHSVDQDRNLKYLIKLFYRRLIPRYATHFMACSEAAGNWLFQGKAPFSILRNAIHVEQFVYSPDKARQIRKQLGIAESTLVVGNVGRFVPSKNRIFLLEIFREVLKKDSNAILLMVGDGRSDYQKLVEKKVRALGLEQNVINLGARSDVYDLLQTMDVFVFPSLYEGLAIAVVEAQAAGIPCVITDTIPPECEVTDLITRVSLQVGAEQWATTSLSAALHEKRSTEQELFASDYDIGENAERLSRFYQEIWNHGTSNTFALYSNADV